MLRTLIKATGLVFVLVLLNPLQAWAGQAAGRGQAAGEEQAPGREQTTTVTGQVVAPVKKEDADPVDIDKIDTAKTGDYALPEMFAFFAAVSGTAAVLTSRINKKSHPDSQTRSIP